MILSKNMLGAFFKAKIIFEHKNEKKEKSVYLENNHLYVSLYKKWKSKFNNY